MRLIRRSRGNEGALRQLRTNPVEAVKRFKFDVKHDADAWTDMKPDPCRRGAIAGGSCYFSESVDNGLVTLEVRPSYGMSNDFYFPYVWGGVGYVRVPRNAPEGSIVCTGAMNGCSFDIYDHGSDLEFVHDANGKNLVNLMDWDNSDPAHPKVAFDPFGSLLKRIPYRAYDPTNMGSQLATRVMNSAPGKRMGYFSHVIFAVKHNLKWYVVDCAYGQTATSNTHGKLKKREYWHYSPHFMDALTTFA